MYLKPKLMIFLYSSSKELFSRLVPLCSSRTSLQDLTGSSSQDWQPQRLPFLTTLILCIICLTSTALIAQLTPDLHVASGLKPLLGSDTTHSSLAHIYTSTSKIHLSFLQTLTLLLRRFPLSLPLFPIPVP